MRIYISGRITGLDYANVEAKFQDAQDLLSDIGFEVVNPLNNGLTKEHSWEQHMDKDFELLLPCDAIPDDAYTDKTYEVSEGKIDINGKILKINLPNGTYSIRKLHPIECERLQTLPDNYTANGINNMGGITQISDAQRYKQLGNGWTVDVIAHILKHIKQ